MANKLIIIDMFPIDNGIKHLYFRYEHIGFGYMCQHYLLSKQARTLRLAEVLRLSDEEAYLRFRAIRFAENNGEPFCGKCGCADVYEFKSRKIFKCSGCKAQFSLTSQTIFANRKLAIRDILAAVAIFMNGAKGHSALQLSRDLGVQYKTAFVLSHKIREAMASQIPTELSGQVEVDGAYFGGYVKPRNYKENRRDRRFAENQSGKRKVVVAMRERSGNTSTQVFTTENESIETIRATVTPGSTIHADEAASWDQLHALYDVKRINHSEAYSHDGACTNQAESFFSRLRRAEIGVHHHIRQRYLNAYASEMAWRENHRRRSNGDQYLLTMHAAAHHPISKQWKGYWQRSMKHAARI
jgi:transposase-like protein